MSAEQEREKYDGLMSRLMESQDVKEAIARALDRMKNNEG
jgi:hypothetical protein